MSGWPGHTDSWTGERTEKALKKMKLMEKILNFILRGMAGCLGNQVLGGIMEGIHVGYNLITFSIAGFLGIPGVLALYGVQFYMLL
mgnify:CR=1 FL=1